MLDGARRLDARHAALALDGRGQGAALAADERARTAVDVDAEGEAAAEDMLAQQAQLLGFFDGGLETRHGQRILGADIDIALVTPGGASGDHHALEHGVGVALHDGAVHECAGVALVAVADDVFLLCLLAARAVPLAPGGEAAAAAPAQTGGDDLLTDLLIRHLEERALKARVAALGDVLLNVLGVARTAVFKHDAVLLFVEGDVLLTRIGHAVEVVGQAVDHLAAEDGSLDDLVAVLGLDVDVHDAHRLDMHERAHLAEAVAAAHLDVEALLLVVVVVQADVDLQTAAFALLAEVVVDMHGTAGDAAGTGADQDGGHLRAHLEIVLCAAAHGGEFFTGQLHALCPSFARISSSSAIAASGAILG